MVIKTYKPVVIVPVGKKEIDSFHFEISHICYYMFYSETGLKLPFKGQSKTGKNGC